MSGAEPRHKTKVRGDFSFQLLLDLCHPRTALGPLRVPTGYMLCTSAPSPSILSLSDRAN